ncbi:MAG: Mur ligase domain-containing protein, partial [Thermoanaerobaculia bacterium]|nr:Mur ligase domain-containing protein [Thermoanaerobaculia bacterium]
MRGEPDRLDPGATFSGAALDSRRVTGGELFFALAGAHTDGHRFVADAISRGASAAVVDAAREVEADGGTLIRVPDCFEA